ncbi:hypothetical protein BH09BAC5_BH09BAC5_27410 [soil metagenome]
MLVKKLIICFVLPLYMLCALQLRAQSTIDSLKASLNESSADSNRVKTLNRLAWKLRSIDPKAAMGYALQSEKLSRDIDFDYGRSEALNTIGVLHYRRGEYVEAVKTHLQALHIRENIGDQEGVALSYINLGNVYSDQLNNNAAIDNYLLAAKTLIAIGNTSQLPFVYLDIGAVFLQENKFEEAIPYCEKAKNGAKQNKDSIVESEALNNLGVAYEGLKKFNLALEAYQSAYEISKATGDKTEMSDNMTNIGNMFRMQQNYVSAIDWHAKAEKLSRETEYLEGLRVLYEQFSKDYEAKGDFKTALSYHIRFKNLSDSLFNEENLTRINALTDKWETDRNEKELLLKQQELFQRQENEKSNEQRLWVIASGGIVMLLFVVYALFANSRMKRNALMIEAQQKLINVRSVD